MQSTTYYFHDGQQVIRTESVNASGVYTGGYQYVWSPRYIDAPICRDTVALTAISSRRPPVAASITLTTPTTTSPPW